MDTDERTEALVRAINARGHVFLSHTRFVVDGESRYIARVAVGSARTEADHVDECFDEIDRGASALPA